MARSHGCLITFPIRATNRAILPVLWRTPGPEAWEHIRKIAGTLRILYTIRNPAERMWSHARFQAQIVGCFDNFSAWSTHEVVTFLEQHGIVAHGGYSRVIARLQQYFDPSEFMVCTFDDVRASPTSALRHIERFLGISQHDYAGTDLSLIHNPSRKMDMPPAFERAMRPYIDAEVAALIDRGISLPAAWSHRTIGHTRFQSGRP
jgi:hypothetical protein